MSYPQNVLRVAGRVVVALSLSLAALVFADANPAFGSRGGDDDPSTDSVINAGASSTTTTTTTTQVTQATTPTTAATPTTVTTADPGAGPAGQGLGAGPVAPLTDPTPVPEAAPAPAEAPVVVAEAADPAPASARQSRPRTLPRTGAGSVTDEVMLGFGLVGAGLAASAAGHRQRRRAAQA